MSGIGTIHRGKERRFAPWKNGGGETAEILCFPSGAGFDDFGWRISTARVAQSGPFSVFPGVTRCLTIIEGGPLALRLGDEPERIMDRDSPPLGFSGETPCDCDLLGDPVLDLNVMTRAPFTARVVRPHMAGKSPAIRLLFVTEALPDLKLARHDLAEVTDLPLASLQALGQTGWLIEIDRI